MREHLAVSTAGYRSRYAADLKKMLPHIPTTDSLEGFQHVAVIGRKLAELHVNYEEAEPHPLDVQLRPGASASNRETWRVNKMKWKSKADHSAIVYNNDVTLAGIPDAAHGYMLGSRTALEWLIDRYQVKTDKASGIVNDPNEWCDEHNDPTYIVELIKKVTTVNVETVKLVARLSDVQGVPGRWHARRPHYRRDNQLDGPPHLGPAIRLSRPPKAQ